MYDELNGRVLEKVRKLIAKAESASSFGTPEGDNEAEALMAKAQELISTYAISEAMLQAAGKSRDDVGTRVIQIPGPYASDKHVLLQMVGKVNRVRAIMTRGLQGAVTTTLVGFATDIQATEVVWTSLLSQCTNEMLAVHYVATSRPGGSTYSFRRNFILAFSQRIADRLQQANARAEQNVQETTGSSVALVLRDRAKLVSEAFRTQFPDVRYVSASASTNAAGRSAGWSAGGRANLGQQGLRSTPALAS